jgi:anti-anti-sigma factor
MAANRPNESYELDPNTPDALKPGLGAPINPRFDVIDRRGIQVITLLHTHVLDSHEIDQLGGELRKHLAKHPGTKVIFDLHGVQHLSSAALSLFIILNTQITSTGGAMRLCGLRDEIHQVFKLTKLDKVVKIKKTVDEAAASL